MTKCIKKSSRRKQRLEEKFLKNRKIQTNTTTTFINKLGARKGLVPLSPRQRFTVVRTYLP